MLPPAIMVIFGATGDLTQRKLMPALFKLFKHGILNEDFEINGFARRSFTDTAFREKMKKAVHRLARGLVNDRWLQFEQLLCYQQGRFEEKEAYKRLARRLALFDRKHKACCNKLYYLATPPRYYETILAHLLESGLSQGCGEQGGWTRILIEKPFGKDLISARRLDAKLGAMFDERQIYRIDHYLGKETIQNIVTFRFANGIFEPVWNREYVDHIQITMSETEGIAGRGAFYDGVGALRDVAQNHLLTMLALTSMEQPRSFDAIGVRDARCKAIKALRAIDEDQVNKFVVRGQYGPGIVNGQRVVGYRQEEEVDQKSNTETFVAAKVFVDTPRWQGVPWYIKSGKRLMKDAVTISLVFRQTCHILFKEYGCPEVGNILTIKIGPEEGIGVRIIAKEPAHAFSLKTVDMDFTYKEAFAHKEVADAYEKILEDALRGDQMLFNRSDELEASWQFITKILNGWENGAKPRFPNYPAGSWGPRETEELIKKDGREWIVSV